MTPANRGIPQVNAVAFTGTHTGMTYRQCLAVKQLLQELRPDVVHHGDCLGADAQFDAFAAIECIRRVAHPCHLRGRREETYRAFCRAEMVHKPLAPLARNRGIVSRCQTLIAAPRTAVEELRSGTWATVRYARQAGLRVLVVNPDGTIVETQQKGFAI